MRAAPQSTRARRARARDSRAARADAALRRRSVHRRAGRRGAPRRATGSRDDHGARRGDRCARSQLPRWKPPRAGSPSKRCATAGCAFPARRSAATASRVEAEGFAPQRISLAVAAEPRELDVALAPLPAAVPEIVVTASRYELVRDAVTAPFHPRPARDRAATGLRRRSAARAASLAGRRGRRLGESAPSRRASSTRRPSC